MSRDTLIGVVSVLALLLGWEAVVAVKLVDPFFVSSPSRIAIAAVDVMSQPSFIDNLSTSALEFAVGLSAAVATGIVMGIVIGWFQLLTWLFEPLLTVIYGLPRLAFLPIIILVLGFGWATTAVVVFMGAVMMVLLAVMTGVRTTSPQLVSAARSFTASRRRIFWTIALPHTLPFVVMGVRLAVGRSLVGVVLGEMYGASAGLGNFIALNGATLQMDRMFVAVALFSISGLLLGLGLSALERHLAPWRTLAEGEGL